MATRDINKNPKSKSRKSVEEIPISSSKEHIGIEPDNKKLSQIIDSHQRFQDKFNKESAFGFPGYYRKSVGFQEYDGIMSEIREVCKRYVMNDDDLDAGQKATMWKINNGVDLVKLMSKYGYDFLYDLLGSRQVQDMLRAASHKYDYAEITTRNGFDNDVINIPIRNDPTETINGFGGRTAYGNYFLYGPNANPSVIDAIQNPYRTLRYIENYGDHSDPGIGDLDLRGLVWLMEILSKMSVYDLRNFADQSYISLKPIVNKDGFLIDNRLIINNRYQDKTAEPACNIASKQILSNAINSNINKQLTLTASILSPGQNEYHDIPIKLSIKKDFDKNGNPVGKVDGVFYMNSNLADFSDGFKYYMLPFLNILNEMNALSDGMKDVFKKYNYNQKKDGELKDWLSKKYTDNERAGIENRVMDVSSHQKWIKFQVNDGNCMRYAALLAQMMHSVLIKFKGDSKGQKILDKESILKQTEPIKNSPMINNSKLFASAASVNWYKFQIEKVLKSLNNDYVKDLNIVNPSINDSLGKIIKKIDDKATFSDLQIKVNDHGIDLEIKTEDVNNPSIIESLSPLVKITSSFCEQTNSIIQTMYQNTNQDKPQDEVSKAVSQCNFLNIFDSTLKVASNSPSHELRQFSSSKNWHNNSPIDLKKDEINGTIKIHIPNLFEKQKEEQKEDLKSGSLYSFLNHINDAQEVEMVKKKSGFKGKVQKVYQKFTTRKQNTVQNAGDRQLFATRESNGLSRI